MIMEAGSMWCSDHKCLADWCLNLTASPDDRSSRYCNAHECNVDRCHQISLLGRPYCRKHSCAVNACNKRCASDDSTLCKDDECKHLGCLLEARTPGGICRRNSHGPYELETEQSQPSASHAGQHSRPPLESHQRYHPANYRPASRPYPTPKSQRAPSYRFPSNQHQASALQPERTQLSASRSQRAPEVLLRPRDDEMFLHV
jgi:hypothetical protein